MTVFPHTHAHTRIKPSVKALHFALVEKSPRVFWQRVALIDSIDNSHFRGEGITPGPITSSSMAKLLVFLASNARYGIPSCLLSFARSFDLSRHPL